MSTLLLVSPLSIAKPDAISVVQVNVPQDDQKDDATVEANDTDDLIANEEVVLDTDHVEHDEAMSH